jgi:hypothetical protein
MPCYVALCFVCIEVQFDLIDHNETRESSHAKCTYLSDDHCNEQDMFQMVQAFQCTTNCCRQVFHVVC